MRRPPPHIGLKLMLVPQIRSRAIGCDLGDRTSHLCLLDREGAVLRRTKIASTRRAFHKFFAVRQSCLVVLEVGSHSRWSSALVCELGHQCVVANPGHVRLILMAWDRSRHWPMRSRSGVRIESAPRGCDARRVAAGSGPSAHGQRRPDAPETPTARLPVSRSVPTRVRLGLVRPNVRQLTHAPILDIAFRSSTLRTFLRWPKNFSTIKTDNRFWRWWFAAEARPTLRRCGTFALPWLPRPPNALVTTS